MKMQLIRHATTILHIHSHRILVDPMFSRKGELSAIPDVPNGSSNPLVELPVPPETLLDCDGILVTHTHRDHWDDAARQLLPKQLPIFCQPADACKFKEWGFEQVIPVNRSVEWKGIRIFRTRGRHGHGATAVKMAPVSGYVLQASDEPVVYITGDTVWCSHVRKTLEKYKPGVVIAYCGEARFSTGKPITLDAADLREIGRNAPEAKIIAVHMEAWNHCRLSRKALLAFLAAEGLEQQVILPADGETVSPTTVFSA